MLVLHTVPAAIGVMLLGALLLGIWTVTLNHCERTGRLPSHTFLDYSLTYLMVATTTSLVAGELGPPLPGGPPNVLDQLRLPSNWPLLGFALAGGASLSLGDVAMQYSCAFLGLTVGPALLNALTLIIGVVLAYLLDGGLNKPHLVFSGMAVATLAIATGCCAHLVASRHQPSQLRLQEQQVPGRRPVCACGPGSSPAAAQQELSSCPRPQGCSAAEASSLCHTCSEPLQAADAVKRGQTPCVDQHVLQVIVGAEGGPVVAASCGAPSPSLVATVPAAAAAAANTGGCGQQRQRSVPTAERHWCLGVGIALLGGTIYAFYLPAFQVAVTDAFHLLPEGTPPPSIFLTNLYFSVGFTAVSLVLNVAFLYAPPLGTQCSSVRAWLADHHCRRWAVASGVLAALGDGCQFLGGEAAGFAASTMVLAYPIIGAAWSMLRGREYQGKGRLAFGLALLQVLLYMLGVALLASSAELRV